MCTIGNGNVLKKIIGASKITYNLIITENFKKYLEIDVFFKNREKFLMFFH